MVSVLPRHPPNFNCPVYFLVDFLYLFNLQLVEVSLCDWSLKIVPQRIILLAVASRFCFGILGPGLV